ncbi:MAG TPA: hypothetical protein VHQ87_03240 [Rhizobacter sp.]|jgi:hypothetical protein|nr:hypothetical protein [Rhizobacter sp.]
MKRVQLHPVAAGGGASIDERYIVEMFDDELPSDARPVALGYALFRPQDGQCSVKVVSRGAHDERHAQAALAALQEFVASARPRGNPP